MSAPSLPAERPPVEDDVRPQERRGLSDTRPHLSHSRINRYLHCPEQYRLYYVENVRPRYANAALVFGQLIHQALARLFKTGEDPAPWFAGAWDEIRETRLKFGARESWEKLQASGEGLLRNFVDHELSRLSRVEAVERPFELDITTLDIPLIGIIDLLADLDGVPSVIDFKTSGTSYGSHEAVLSDQLATYQLAAPRARQGALCVLVKTKEPAIEWHVTQHSGGDLLQFLEKASLVAREIAAARFYKRPGKWCAWCDFLPICVGDVEKAERDLVRLDVPTAVVNHVEAM